ncbi:MAG: TetR/AcrR family transcriptional regulator [Acidimicrobiia bacterium]|jgi:AcrR family transcriptional regulator
MPVQRQGEIAETGRVNQKKRTRAAVVQAARDLVQQGITPTVAQAAEVALVSRTTAYRYFPTQESLLLELAVNADVDDIEDLVAEPVTAAEAPERAVEVLQRFNRRVLDDEVQYRTTLRLYLDQWLAAAADGESSPVVREGRRTRWLATSLAPLRGTVPDADLDRLVAALSILTGVEAMSVLREVCQLSEDDALAVTDWAARVLIAATRA